LQEGRIGEFDLEAIGIGRPFRPPTATDKVNFQSGPSRVTTHHRAFRGSRFGLFGHSHRASHATDGARQCVGRTLDSAPGWHSGRSVQKEKGQLLAKRHNLSSCASHAPNARYGPPEKPALFHHNHDLFPRCRPRGRCRCHPPKTTHQQTALSWLSSCHVTAQFRGTRDHVRRERGPGE
jgi:hypothetical protein